MIKLFFFFRNFSASKNTNATNFIFKIITSHIYTHTKPFTKQPNIAFAFHSFFNVFIFESVQRVLLIITISFIFFFSKKTARFSIVDVLF